MARQHVNEVPLTTPVSEEEEARRLEAFTRWVNYKSSVIRDSAAAYANQRARKSPYNVDGVDATVSKIVSGATFIPAHPSRFKVLGKNRGRKFKYFIVHRPGAPSQPIAPHDVIFPGEAGFDSAFAYAMRACSLKNTVYEFTQNTGRPVCTHFVIGKGGELIQMVDLDDVAQHTRNVKHPKDASLPQISNYNAVGVELEGPIFDTFSGAQLQQCAILLRMMHDLYGIPLDFEDDKRLYVLGHDEIDPRRKLDPWSNFPYATVLNWAQKLSPYTPDSIYQEPTGVLEASLKLVGAAKSNTLSVGSGYLRDISISATDMMDVDIRAVRRRSLSREQLMQQRNLFSGKQTAALLELASSLLKANTINEVAAITPPAVGALFNWTTGLWENVAE